MYAVGEEAWAAALCALFEDEYVFVAVGPRGGGAWEEDALAVMRREVADPRDWAGQDWDEDSTERTSSRPGFPFTPGSPEEIARKLREIDAGTRCGCWSRSRTFGAGSPRFQVSRRTPKAR
jgi:hypothetical protein